MLVSCPLSSFPNLCVIVLRCSLDFLSRVFSFPVVVVYHPVCWSLSLWSWSTIQCVGLSPCGLGLPLSVLVSLPVVLVYHQCVGLSPGGLGLPSSVLVCFPVLLVYHQCVGLSPCGLGLPSSMLVSLHVVLVYHQCVGLSPCGLGLPSSVLVSLPVVLVYHPVCWSLSLWSWSAIQRVGLSPCGLGLPSVCWSLSLWSWSTINVLVSLPVVLVYHQFVGLSPCGLGLPSSVLVSLPVVLVYHPACWSLSLWLWSTISVLPLSQWSGFPNACIVLFL